MTTAHRPTFDPAQGREAQRGPAYHQRLLPAYTQLKHRKSGQGTTGENEGRDLAAELLRAEAAHYAKKNGKPIEDENTPATLPSSGPKRQLEGEDGGDGGDDNEAPEAKRRRLILEEAYEIDAASDTDSDSDSSSSEDDDDEEDETAELMRELDKIKKERAAAKAKEEAEKAVKEQEAREFDIARGNPLMNPNDFNVKRRWDDDVVFKNQARGTEDRNKKKEFVNDLLRSDFHRRFMVGNPHGAGVVKPAGEDDEDLTNDYY